MRCGPLRWTCRLRVYSGESPGDNCWPVGVHTGDNRGMDRPELVAEVDRAWARPVVLTPVFALISLVGGASPSFGLRANLLVLATGGVLFWLGLTAAVPRRASPPRLSRGAAWWLLPLLLFGVVEGATF